MKANIENLILPKIYTLEWATALIFSGVLLIAFIIGAIMATRSTIYFLVFNLIGLILIYVIPKEIFNFWSNLISSFKLKIAKNTYFIPIIHIIQLISINIVATIIYLPFRSKVKSKFKDKKNYGQSLMKDRLIGGFLALIPGLLFAILFTVAFIPIVDYGWIGSNVEKYLYGNLILTKSLINQWQDYKSYIIALNTIF